jgi:hypothetical protein
VGRTASAGAVGRAGGARAPRRGAEAIAASALAIRSLAPLLLVMLATPARAPNRRRRPTVAA